MGGRRGTVKHPIDYRWSSYAANAEGKKVEWLTPHGEYLALAAEESNRLAAYRGETVHQFSSRFVRRVGNRLSLIEKPGGDCIFWEKSVGCTVYPARPVQCQTWPFWPENIESRENWEHLTKVCPGSGKGRVFTVEEIRDSAARVHE